MTHLTRLSGKWLIVFWHGRTLKSILVFSKRFTSFQNVSDPLQKHVFRLSASQALKEKLSVRILRFSLCPLPPTPWPYLDFSVSLSLPHSHQLSSVSPGLTYKHFHSKYLRGNFETHKNIQMTKIHRPCVRPTHILLVHPNQLEIERTWMSTTLRPASSLQQTNLVMTMSKKDMGIRSSKQRKWQKQAEKQKFHLETLLSEV